MIVFGIETYNTDRAVPYPNCKYRRSKFQVNVIEI